MPEASPDTATSVLLEVGRGHGALVVHVPDVPPGTEIEIRPATEIWQGRHSAVRRFHTPTGLHVAAVFPSLEEGSYEIRWRGGARPELPVRIEVASARVTEVSLHAG